METIVIGHLCKVDECPLFQLPQRSLKAGYARQLFGMNADRIGEPTLQLPFAHVQCRCQSVNACVAAVVKNVPDTPRHSGIGSGALIKLPGQERFDQRDPLGIRHGVGDPLFQEPSFGAPAFSKVRREPGYLVHWHGQECSRTVRLKADGKDAGITCRFDIHKAAQLSVHEGAWLYMALARSRVLAKEITKVENQLHTSIGKDSFMAAVVGGRRFKTPVALHKRSEFGMRKIGFIDHGAVEPGSLGGSIYKIVEVAGFCHKRSFGLKITRLALFRG